MGVDWSAQTILGVRVQRSDFLVPIGQRRECSYSRGHLTSSGDLAVFCSMCGHKTVIRNIEEPTDIGRAVLGNDDFDEADLPGGYVIRCLRPDYCSDHRGECDHVLGRRLVDVGHMGSAKGVSMANLDIWRKSLSEYLAAVGLAEREIQLFTKLNVGY